MKKESIMDNPMAQSAKYLKINLALMLIAAAVAIYLVWHHYQLINGEAGFGSFCSLNQTVDCDVVNTSKFSEVLGIPLATFALSYHLFAVILSFVGARNAFARREVVLLLFPFSVIAALVSLGAFGISALVLQKFCLMCSALQILNLASAAMVALALKSFLDNNPYAAEWKQAQKNRIYTLLGLGAGIFMVVALISSQLKKEFPFHAEEFLSEFRAQPTLSVDPGNSPRQGFQGENPPIQIVEFADFQCPACEMAAKQMHRLVKNYGDKVQLIFKNFPLDSSCNSHIPTRMHQHACLAAKASLCAGQQGKFVDYYERLFSHQKEISPETIQTWASELGLNKEAFGACLESQETSIAIQKDIDLAATLGLQSTPTFFVNGKKVEGVIDENRLRAIIKELGKQ